MFSAYVRDPMGGVYQGLWGLSPMSRISPVQFYLVKHWKEVILCLILDIRY